jgi:hypothetical protein
LKDIFMYNSACPERQIIEATEHLQRDITCASDTTNQKLDVIIRLLQGKPPYPNPPQENWTNDIPEIQKRLTNPDPNAHLTQTDIAQILQELNALVGGN